MRFIPIKKLYNPQYDLLSISDKEELLDQIGEIYNLELISFKHFAAFRQSTYTAVYRSHDGIDFVFVPGDTVTLGFDFKNKPFQDIFNDSETCWIPISNETLRQNKEWQQMIEKAKSEGLSEIMIHNTICLYQTDDNNWYGKLYEETTFKELLQNIKKHGYSLPTRREWEYLVGKGCRTIFPWGNNIDFSMNLKHMEWMDNDGEYTLGDGGRNICGGLGVMWGYLPVSPYFQDSEMVIGDNINGGYDFFRRVIRINDNMK